MKNIVIWGLGGHAIKNIIPAIVSSNYLNLYGIYTRNHEVLVEHSKKFNCLKYESEESMLEDDDIDIIFLSTPIGLHAKHGIKVLESEKHLWCEKPLTSDLLDTQELISLSKQNQLMVAEGFMYLHHPHFNAVKSFIYDQLQYGMISINIKFGIPFLDNPGFRMTKQLAGGAYWDVGTYPISAILSLFPESKLEVLSSEIRSEKDFEVDISGNARILIDSIHNISIEWGIGTSYRNEIDIWGKNESLFTDKIFSKPRQYFPELEIRDKKGVKKSIKLDANDHFELMLDDFYKTLDDDSLMSKKRDEILARSLIFNKIRNFKD